MKHFLYTYILLTTVLYMQFNFSLGYAVIGHNVVPAEDKQFPFVVSIGRVDPKLSREENHICTGTLIKTNLVLTAAHCFDDEELNPLQVLAGSVSLQKCVPYRINTWFSSDGYGKKRNYKHYLNSDVAVVLLFKDIDASIIEPAAISTKPNTNLYGSSVTIAGWGKTESNVTPTILRTAVVNILSEDECKTKVEKAAKKKPDIGEHILCSAAKPWSLISCGDSGGPLLDANNAVVGVCRGDCPNNEVLNLQRVNLHYSVYFYREFIMDAMANF